MATIVRTILPITRPVDSLFSQSCLYRRISPKHGICKTRLLYPRWSAKAFTNSTALYEKKYTKDHEWIELSDDGKIGTIGISEFAANALGDVVYIELPALDTEIHAGDTIGAVESVKSASDILTPLSGKVVAKNDFLEEKPGFINKEPEGKGWIARIEVVPGEEVEGLMGREEYRKFTEE